VNHFRAWSACALLGALTLAACGSDDDSSDATSAPTSAAAETSTPGDTTAPADTTAETTPAEDPLGTPNPATGDPVKIGLITEAGGDAISSQAQLAEQGAQIAAHYINEYGGGLAGHPIDLVVCGNKASASGASDCANQMVEQGVSAVVWPFTGFGPQQVPIITSAGGYLPYVFLGSLVFESFFGIPGLGAYTIEAISKQDFAIVRTMVFVGSVLAIASYILIDIAYTWADPRVRLD